MLAPFPRSDPANGVVVAKMALAIEFAVIVAGYDATFDATGEARSVGSPAVLVALRAVADKATSKNVGNEGIMKVRNGWFLL